MGSPGQVSCIIFRRDAYVSYTISREADDVWVSQFTLDGPAVESFAQSCSRVPSALLRQDQVLLHWDTPKEEATVTVLDPAEGGSDVGRLTLLVCTADLETSKTLRINHSTRATAVEEVQELPCTSQASKLHRRYAAEFDLDGNFVSTIWGVALHKDVAALCTTVSPTTMPVYPSVANEKSFLTFESVSGSRNIDPPSRLRKASAVREEIALWTLKSAKNQPAHYEMDEKLVYAMVACTMTAKWGRPHRDLCKSINTLLDVDLGAEHSGCVDDGSSATREGNGSVVLPARSKAQLQYAGYREVFEYCNICEEGMSWSSPDWADCYTGHRYSRSSDTDC